MLYFFNTLQRLRTFTKSPFHSMLAVLLPTLLAISGIEQPAETFLLYDVISHEQVNKQRRALMFYLDLARKLKRTLVLPR